MACFVMTEEEKARMMTKSWEKASEIERQRVQVASGCCGFTSAILEQANCAEVWYKPKREWHMLILSRC